MARQHGQIEGRAAAIAWARELRDRADWCVLDLGRIGHHAGVPAETVDKLRGKRG